MFTFVLLLPYPPGHSGVGPLFELRVRREALPHDIGRVVLVPQFRTAFKQEVYDEELYASIQACEESTDAETRKNEKSFFEKLTFTSQRPSNFEPFITFKLNTTVSTFETFEFF